MHKFFKAFRFIDKILVKKMHVSNMFDGLQAYPSKKPFFPFDIEYKTLIRSIFLDKFYDYIHFWLVMKG